MEPSVRAVPNTSPVLLSIGVENGGCVLRFIMPDKSRMTVETNMRSFARLAAKGITVINDTGWRAVLASPDEAA